MKVVSIESTLVEVPLRGAFRNAHAVKSVLRSVVVRLRTDAGCEGIGNVDPTTGYSETTSEDIVRVIRERIWPAVHGRDATLGLPGRRDRAG